MTGAGTKSRTTINGTWTHEGDKDSALLAQSNYGFDGYGCGLCRTGVACESRTPTERDV